MDIKQSKDHLYFIQMGDTNYIKIGRSTDPYKRIKNITLPNKSKIILIKENWGGGEKFFHNKLRMHRTNQEWFYLDNPSIEFIKNDQLDLLMSFY